MTLIDALGFAAGGSGSMAAALGLHQFLALAGLASGDTVSTETNIILPIGVLLAGMSVVATIVWRAANERNKLLSQVIDLKHEITALRSVLEEHRKRSTDSQARIYTQLGEARAERDQIDHRLTVVETRCSQIHGSSAPPVVPRAASKPKS